MRLLTGLLLSGAAFAAAPSVASAADTPMCPRVTTPDLALQQRMGSYLGAVMSVTTPGSGVTPTLSGGEAADAVQAVLGAQQVRLWLDHTRHGWSVAFSPGAHDATTARAAIRSYLATRLPASEVDYLDSTLTLLPTPYSTAELREVTDALSPHTVEPGIIGNLQPICTLSDGVRVEVGIADPETPELRAQAEALVAPYGDKVRLHFGVGRFKTVPGFAPGPPLSPAPPVVPAPAAKTPRLREHVTLPVTARCVRSGTLKVTAGKSVQKLRLAAGARKAFAPGGKVAKLKLKARRTKVAVTVTLKDGTTATQTLTYRRCA